jgi:hypothetical protein
LPVHTPVCSFIAQQRLEEAKSSEDTDMRKGKKNSPSIIFE